MECLNAHVLVAYMLLTDVGACKTFSQSPSGQPPVDSSYYSQHMVSMADRHDHNTVQSVPGGSLPAEQVWQELCLADRQNFILCAWTTKDLAGGASGIIRTDGIIKQHLYAIVG